MAFDKGWDFRLTSGFVTDPANCTYDVGENYPTVRNGATFGWDGTAGFDARDRNSGIDARIAGIIFCTNNATVFTWRLDLPAAGDYLISLAMGDGAGGNAQKNYIVIKDDTTPVLSFAPVSSGTTTWADATSTLLTSATWPSSNTAVQKTFASSILRLTLGGTVDTDSSCIAHLRVVSVDVSKLHVPRPAFLAQI